MTIVTAITGASGAAYAQRFLQGLVAAGVQTHLVISPLGRRLLYDELGMETPDLETLAGTSSPTSGHASISAAPSRPGISPASAAGWSSARVAWSSSASDRRPPPTSCS